MDEKKFVDEKEPIHDPLFDHLEDEIAEEEQALEEERPKVNHAQNERLKQAKQVSLQYVEYLKKALAKPYDTMKQVGPEHWTLSLISIGFVILCLPLFFTVSAARLGMPFSFYTTVIQPILYGVLGIAAAIASIYFNLRMHRSGVHANMKAITIQYAALLAPAIVGLVLAMVAGLVGLGILLPLFFLVASFVVIIGGMNLVIFSYPEKTSKFDPLYGLLIGNIVTGYFFYKLMMTVISGMLIGTISGWVPW
mgnify:CR=1 FL=1